MIIKALAENIPISKDFGSEHGLSLHLEANGRKILLMLEQVNYFLIIQKFNINISDVNYLINIPWAL